MNSLLKLAVQRNLRQNIHFRPITQARSFAANKKAAPKKAKAEEPPKEEEAIPKMENTPPK